MLRGRYGWLSQRNQFILPTFLTRTTPPHPSSPVEGKKRLGRRIRAHRERERERKGKAQKGREIQRETLAGNVVEARSRGDSSGLMASLFGSMPHLLINRIASDRLPV